MLVEINAPASFALGLVNLQTPSGSTLASLGLSLQQPLVQLQAQAQDSLNITGPRADVARQHALRFFAHHEREPRGWVEIELGIARAMGLGSRPTLALSTARALAWANDLLHNDVLKLARATGLGAEDALAIWGFDRGGLLLVETQAPGAGLFPAVLRRAEIAHEDKRAWVFVFYLPPTPAGAPPTLDAMRQAGPLLSPETGRLLEDALWPAVAQDDLPAFAAALMALQALNHDALAQSGQTRALSADDTAILDLMRDNGALAWGQAADGAALFGLLRGAPASIQLRQRLYARAGYFSGTIMAAIADNAGAQLTTKDDADLRDGKTNLPRQRV